MGERTIFRKELTEGDMERMRIPRRYWDCSLDGIPDEEGDPPAREVAQRYLSRLDEMLSRGIGLLLKGGNGRGKTGMAVVICKEARRRGYKVLFIETWNLKRCAMEKIVFDEDQSMLERAQAVDLLVLDDLGKGVQDKEGFGARLLDELIRYRNANQLATFITTNMDKEQLEVSLKRSTLHSLKECAVPVVVRGPDRRDEQKEDLLGLLMSNSA